MYKQLRPKAPQILIDNWQNWSKAYFIKRFATNHKHQFYWKKVNRVTVNKILLPVLSQMSHDHCAYCDKYPLDDRCDLTIDHFYPKQTIAHYLLVYKWENLYLSCMGCQRAKMEQFSDLLLRPDANSYSFLAYFTYDYQTHKLDVNPNMDSVSKARADKTIKIFDLNSSGLVSSRKRSYKLYISEKSPYIHDFDFRYMFE